MWQKIVPQTVKAKLLVIVGFSFFLLVGGIVVSTSIEKKKTFLQGEQFQLQAKYDQVQKVFEDSAAEALSMAFVVAEMPEVQRLFAEGDRVGLSAITLPMFKNLKEQLHLPSFNFRLLLPLLFFVCINRKNLVMISLPYGRRWSRSISRNSPFQGWK